MLAILLFISQLLTTPHSPLSPQGGDGSEASLIVFTGDILLDRGVRLAIQREGIDQLFCPAVDSIFAAAHCVVANLECPATHLRQPVQKIYNFRAEPEWLADLRRHGITHLNLANNHSIDQGRRALLDTRRNILTAGITPFGADTTMEAAAQPILLTTTPRHVWLLPALRLPLENFAYLPARPSPAQETLTDLCRRISMIRQQQPSAVIIVTLHWGTEHALRPEPSQVEEAHRIADAGADVIIGHHTHTLQTIEQYNHTTIYYSLGNFIFDPSKEINRKAAIVALTVTQESTKCQTIPIRIEGCTPHPIEMPSDK